MNASKVLYVWVIGIQQEKIISQNVFVTQVSGLHHYKGKNSQFFFLTVTYLSRFHCGHPWWNNRYPDNIHSLCAFQMRQPFMFVMELWLNTLEDLGKQKLYVRCGLVRDSAKVSVWCNLMLNRMMKHSCSFSHLWLWLCTWTFWNCMRFFSYYKTENHLTTAILWGITSHTLVPELSTLHTLQTSHNLIGLCCCPWFSWWL
jgi:hypothetical protein